MLVTHIVAAVLLALSPISRITPKSTRCRIPILDYQDDFVVVNKPAGLTTHHSADSMRGRGRRLVLSSMLKRQLRRKVQPVHRLDHRTSGALLFAFNSEACAKLQAAISEPTTLKHYVALVRNEWRHGDTAFTCDAPVSVGRDKDNVKTYKNATTTFTVIASQKASNDDKQQAATLLRCEPKTGRSHQIRKHLFMLGHPIIGDTEHGDSKVNRWWRQERNFDRLGLHCIELTLPNILSSVAPLDDEWSAALKNEPLWDLAVQKDPRLTAEFEDYRGGTFKTNNESTKQ
ncbi:hypothetical protein TrLO_g12605 [Triparma laevis f. longispina]|uniref:Pseudouridine synthase RsuA/RluA-like domain-containing protein n=1 Tax=Triparma laevis f. longispina TaxID=1714387 RepID=A0A9W7DM23_9STRA|nr:hypothetical protein TrLO_g12605 [Triparma laevis f. longispina]